MIKDKLKILIVEDDLSDYQLIVHQIRKVLEQPVIEHATTYLEFTTLLNSKLPDIILSDYGLTGFTGMNVLEYTMNNYANKHLVFVTGTVHDEEIAANTILNGASGYILKKHMQILAQKLKPHFETVIRRKKEIRANHTNTADISDIKAYINAALKNNEMHIESYNVIKQALTKYKNENNDSKLS